jgi:hypothetical protein
MAVDSCVGILPARSTDLDGPGNLQEFPQVHPVVYARSWLDVMDHRNMDIHLVGVASQDPYQYGEEEKKDWLFEVILLTLILPFFDFWAGVPSVDLARYVRGLLSLPSHILHILHYFSISYCDTSQT